MKLELIVDGMACQHCVAAVTKATQEAAPGAAVDVDLETKRVSVQGENLDSAAIKEAIEDQGYDVLSVS